MVSHKQQLFEQEQIAVVRERQLLVENQCEMPIGIKASALGDLTWLLLLQNRSGQHAYTL